MFYSRLSLYEVFMTVFEKRWWMIVFFLGALSVMIGAFGAHALRARVSPEDLKIFETGVKYQFYHVLAMGLVLVLFTKTKEYKLLLSLKFFLIGILIFSGSLYALVVLNQRWLGMVTPIGGMSFIIGWILAAMSLLGQKAVHPFKNSKQG